jgi:sugar/nucleoside kinase (ribokinase family)
VKTKKAVVAGHICLDITPALARGTDISLLRPGSLIHTGAADIHTGGCVANTGLAMRFFGADAVLAGKVGDDAFGTLVSRALEAYGAADGLIVERGGNTSYSVVLAPEGADRIFLHHPGVNDTFDEEDITEELLRGAALFHFGYPPIMRKTYLDGGNTLAAILKKAKDAGCATSLDTASVDPSSEAGRADWERILSRALPYTDFFLPSAEELAYMLDRSLWQDWQARAKGGDVADCIDLLREIPPLAEKVLALGAKTTVIKCGARGMYWRTARACEMQNLSAVNAADWAEKFGFESAFAADRVVSATGAGDTSIAAFLTAMLQGEPPETCVALAAGAGACCVTEYDALSGLIPLDGIRKKIADGWKKSSGKESIC